MQLLIVLQKCFIDKLFVGFITQSQVSYIFPKTDHINNTQADLVYLYVSSYSIFPLLSLHQPTNLKPCTQDSAEHRYTDKICTSNSYPNCYIYFVFGVFVKVYYYTKKHEIYEWNVQFSPIPLLNCQISELNF